MVNSAEDEVWHCTDPDYLWVMDKLILSRKLGYSCGPVGLPVPESGEYIVRPCVNMLGLGLGASKEYLKDATDHLPVGFFWCEWFEGRHLSVDYLHGRQILCVEGHKPPHTFTRWTSWNKTKDVIPFPDILSHIDVPIINCEFIGGRLIEVHLRHNEDFQNEISDFIPVWEGQSIDPPVGYKYIEYPDIHGRIGAYVK